MNTHEHLSIEILADYAEGLLGDADSTSVAEHLASCADCRAEADLLASVTEILAADDPGPMPEHYAARIDAALADLAATEPVTPKPAPATAVAAGATVVDLASRRRFTPAARVTSVAASLVLLIGGVALGMQALDNGPGGQGDGFGALDNPVPTPTDNGASADRAALLAAREKPTGSLAKKGKNGAVIDKTDGTVFLKNKVYFPDGSVVVHKKNGDAQVTVASTRAGDQPVVRTFRASELPAQTPAPARSTPAATPTPATTPRTTPRATPNGAPTAAAVPATAPAYVTNSGDTYTEDNFATQVRALLRAAGETTGSVSAQSVSDSSAPSPSGQNRVSSSAVQTDETATDRGPAPADVQARVRRCATQLKLSPVVAADAGIWKGQSATILVVRQDEAKQATGYVVLGDCTREAPATQDSVVWFAPVDVPSGSAEEPTPAPSTNPGTTSGDSSSSPSSSTSSGVSSGVSNGVSSGVSDTVSPTVASTSPATTE